MNEKNIWDDIESLTGSLTLRTQKILDLLDEDPEGLGSMSIEDAKKEFSEMRDEDVFAMIYRQMQAEDALRSACEERSMWFRRKGRIATRILELEAEAKKQTDQGAA